jgi:hypothetical protein
MCCFPNFFFIGSEALTRKACRHFVGLSGV